MHVTRLSRLKRRGKGVRVKGWGECGTFGDSFCVEETNHPFAHALSEIEKLHQHVDLCVLFVHVAEINGMASVPSPRHAQQHQPMDSSLC